MKKMWQLSFLEFAYDKEMTKLNINLYIITIMAQKLI